MDTTNNQYQINSIIRNCDKAFVEPVAERPIYSDLLLKIHQKGIFVYAYSGEQVLGYCAFYANDSDTQNAYISLIAVRPESQNLHVGSQLLKVCENIAECYGMCACSLEVKKDNSSAIRFYQTNGFVFLNERENSFLMKKELFPLKGKTYEYQRKESNSSCDGKTGLRND